jgi:negative regulator of sigma-B (phosphoserine phosphatase)
MASRAFGGATVSGDAALAEQRADAALVAVVDALGHGVAAGVVAAIALEAVRRAEGPVTEIALRAHERLLGTLGVVMGLAAFRPDALEWIGVGNVEGVLWHGNGPSGGHDDLLACPGVMGQNLPELRPKRVPLAPGDVLVLATDGVGPAFADRRPLDASPQAAADALLAEHARGTDDALVVVARYDGVASDC